MAALAPVLRAKGGTVTATADQNGLATRGHRLLRFIHTADWQIGKPYRSVEDDKKRYRLQHERVAAIDRIGGVARDQNASFVVEIGRAHV